MQENDLWTQNEISMSLLYMVPAVTLDRSSLALTGNLCKPGPSAWFPLWLPHPHPPPHRTAEVEKTFSFLGLCPVLHGLSQGSPSVSPPFHPSRDWASPVVTTAVLVRPTVCQKSLRLQDMAKSHLTQALNPKSLSSWPHLSTLPFWFGVLITRLGLRAPSVWTVEFQALGL